jgi:hypothetical protein
LGPLPHSAWISFWPNSFPPDELAVIALVDHSSNSAGSNLASSKAICVAASAICVQRSVCTCRRRSIQSSALKSSTSPANWVAYLEGSKRLILAIPLVASLVAFHHSSVPIPFGATTPTPVITDRRLASGVIV